MCQSDSLFGSMPIKTSGLDVIQCPEFMLAKQADFSNDLLTCNRFLHCIEIVKNVACQTRLNPFLVFLK